MKFKSGLYAILFVLVIHFVLLLMDGYGRFYQIDILMHLMGGFAWALIALALETRVKSCFKKSLPTWYRYIFVAGFVLMIGVAWEFHEYALDQTINIWYHIVPSQPSLADTMKDLLDDWIGASAAFFLFQKKK